MARHRPPIHTLCMMCADQSPMGSSKEQVVKRPRSEASDGRADSLTPRRRRWLIARGLLRALVTAVLMVVLYYTLPLGSLSDVSLVAELVGRRRAPGRHDHLAGRGDRDGRRTPPSGRRRPSRCHAPLFLLFFASTYYILSADDAATFTEPLSRSDALYFTVTIFATVGFGDISAQTESARLFVTARCCSTSWCWAWASRCSSGQ